MLDLHHFYKPGVAARGMLLKQKCNYNWTHFIVSSGDQISDIVVDVDPWRAPPCSARREVSQAEVAVHFTRWPAEGWDSSVVEDGRLLEEELLQQPENSRAVSDWTRCLSLICCFFYMDLYQALLPHGLYFSFFLHLFRLCSYIFNKHLIWRITTIVT